MFGPAAELFGSPINVRARRRTFRAAGESSEPPSNFSARRRIFRVADSAESPPGNFRPRRFGGELASEFLLRRSPRRQELRGGAPPRPANGALSVWSSRCPPDQGVGLDRAESPPEQTPIRRRGSPGAPLLPPYSPRGAIPL